MKLTKAFPIEANLSHTELAERFAWQNALQTTAENLAGYSYADIRQHMIRIVEKGDYSDVEAFDLLVLTQINKLYQPDCPARAVIELPMVGALADDIATRSQVIPPFAGTALVTVSRANHDSFERTALPSHIDVEMIACNGGVSTVQNIPLKGLGAWMAFYLFVEELLPKAHAAGPQRFGEDASAVYAGAIAAASLAVQQHVARPF